MRPAFTNQLRKCRSAYYEDSQHTPDDFYDMLLETYGIKITMADNGFQHGISDIDIVDDQKYLMFELKYA